MKKLTAILIILYSGMAHSAEGDLWLDVNVASYHTSSEYCYKDKCDDWNQLNYGVGVSYEVDSLFELTGGYFRNSYNKNSFYAGTKMKHDLIINNFIVTPGVVIAFTTGYNNTEVEAKKIQLFGLPTISLSHDNYRAVVGYLPIRILGLGSTDVFTLQLGIKF